MIDEEMQMRRWLRRPTLLAANAMYLLATAGLALTALVLGALYALLARGGMALSPLSLLTISTLLSALFLLVPACRYALRHPGVSMSMRLEPPALRMMLFALISAPVAVWFVQCLSILWQLAVEAMGGQFTQSSIPTPQNSAQLTLMILLVGVVPGICEEVLFRGAIFGAWERRGTKYALAVSAALFCLLHGSLEGLPAQLIMGLVLGYVMVCANSIYVSMLYHTVYNSAILMLLYIAPEVEPTGAQSTLELIGGASGAVQLVFYTVVIGLLFLGTLQPFRLELARLRRPFEAVKIPDRSKMGWRELLVLMVALITVAVFYLENLSQIFGWLR